MADGLPNGNTAWHACHMATQTISKRVAQTVRELLRAQHLTQDQLSGLTGIPARTLARRLHQKHPSGWSLEELDMVADVLDVSVTSLLTGERATGEARQKADAA